MRMQAGLELQIGSLEEEAARHYVFLNSALYDTAVVTDTQKYNFYYEHSISFPENKIPLTPIVGYLMRD